MKKTTSYKNEIVNRLTAFINRVAEIAYSKSQNRYDYGEDNLLPNLLLKGVESSVTASACRSRKAEFIEGAGLTENGDFAVNPDQTADDIIMEMSDTVGIFDGLAVSVKYNNVGEPARMYV